MTSELSRRLAVDRVPCALSRKPLSNWALVPADCQTQVRYLSHRHCMLEGRGWRHGGEASRCTHRR